MQRLHGAMRSLAEETILMISVFKWFTLATIIGVLVGGGTAGFIIVLEKGTIWFQSYPNYFIFCLWLCSSVPCSPSPLPRKPRGTVQKRSLKRCTAAAATSRAR